MAKISWTTISAAAIVIAEVVKIQRFIAVLIDRHDARTSTQKYIQKYIRIISGRWMDRGQRSHIDNALVCICEWLIDTAVFTKTIDEREMKQQTQFSIELTARINTFEVHNESNLEISKPWTIQPITRNYRTQSKQRNQAYRFPVTNCYMDEHRRRNLWPKENLSCIQRFIFHKCMQYWGHTQKKIDRWESSHHWFPWTHTLLTNLIPRQCNFIHSFFAWERVYVCYFYWLLSNAFNAKTDTSNFSNTLLTLIEIVVAMAISIPSFQWNVKQNIPLMNTWRNTLF